jgi:hypothetical protein
VREAVHHQEYDWIFGNSGAAGVVLDFSLFEDFSESVDGQRDCIVGHFDSLNCALDQDQVSALNLISPLSFEPSAFFGDWGLEKHQAVIPKLGDRSHFTYAFGQPPHGIHADTEVKRDAIAALQLLLWPQGVDVIPYDWSCLELGLICPEYYHSGLEWWGVFLFAIEIPSIKRLWIASASATD